MNLTQVKMKQQAKYIKVIYFKSSSTCVKKLIPCQWTTSYMGTICPPSSFATSVLLYFLDISFCNNNYPSFISHKI